MDDSMFASKARKYVREDEEFNGAGPKKKVVPSDREILADDGLQQTIDILMVSRKFLEKKYPHITHIAGWTMPEKYEK
jgi:hypothetical protein